MVIKKIRIVWKWFFLVSLVLAMIIVPFLFFGEQLDAWTEAVLGQEHRPVWLATVLGGLLASDILLPIPSSIVSTACGFFFGVVGGTLISFTGMTISCAIGYYLALRPGKKIAQRMVGAEVLERLHVWNERFGDWVIVLARPVPVLAEASVLFAGMASMKAGRFFALSILSNLAISLVYAVVGAFSAGRNSFLFAVAGSVLLPWLVMTIAGVFRPRSGRSA